MAQTKRVVEPEAAVADLTPAPAMVPDTAPAKPLRIMRFGKNFGTFLPITLKDGRRFVLPSGNYVTSDENMINALLEVAEDNGLIVEPV